MINKFLSKEDVSESFVRSSGPGGQNVNKVNSCVVLVHKPTGIIVRCQKFRTQHQNRQQAWVLLRESLRQAQERQRLLHQAQREKKRRQNRRRSLSAKERMLEAKKKHTYKKQNRKKVKSWE